jgi:hypothetical protein
MVCARSMVLSLNTYILDDGILSLLCMCAHDRLLCLSVLLLEFPWSAVCTPPVCLQFKAFHSLY